LLAGCYAEAATIRGVAEQLGRTANAVYKHLHRLRSALLKCVGLRLGTDGSSADAFGPEGAT
jgi:DNA-directed RNA polymerase specialized sigma24 family protein